MNNNNNNQIQQNQSSFKADQMRNIDYFMNNIINNIANNNTESIPANNIQVIQKMLDQQNEPGNPGLSAYLPLNTSTNNRELNDVNNVANNFGKIVEAISNFNNKNITHNNNVMSTVGNLTGLLTNIYAEQDNINSENKKGNFNNEANNNDDEKKEKGIFFN